METDRMIRISKRLTAVMLAAVLVPVLAASYGSRNQVVNYEVNSREQEEITIFGNEYEPENVKVIEEIISSFMEENPDICVGYESAKGDEYYEALRKRMAFGNGDDVFMINHDVFLELEQQGQVANLAGFSTIENYTDWIRSQIEENGNIYWVPTAASAFGLYCNLGLLKKHRQEAPGNLREWEQTCDYFLGQGITPVIVDNDISLKALAIDRGFFEVYQEQRQTEVFARLNDGEARLGEYLGDGSAVVKRLIDNGYVDAEKTLNTEKTSDDLEEFVRGEPPFMLTGAWTTGRVEKMNPGFPFEVAPLPVLEDGLLLVIDADTRLSVNKNSRHLEAALRFVEYFAQADNIRIFVDQQSSFGPLGTGSPSPVEEVQPLMKDYQTERIVIGTDGMLNLPIWNVTEEVSKRLLSGEDLEAAMAWMDEQDHEGDWTG